MTRKRSVVRGASVRRRRRLAAAMSCLAVVVAVDRAEAIEPPQELLALYYMWGGFAERCVGRAPEVTPEVAGEVKRIGGVVERMTLAMQPEAERAGFRRRAEDDAAAGLSKFFPAPTDFGGCAQARTVLGTLAAHLENLKASLRGPR